MRNLPNMSELIAMELKPTNVIKYLIGLTNFRNRIDSDPEEVVSSIMYCSNIHKLIREYIEYTLMDGKSISQRQVIWKICESNCKSLDFIEMYKFIKKM